MKRDRAAERGTHLKKRCLTGLLLVMLSLSLAGCGKKKQEEPADETNSVIQITVTPIPSPTPMLRSQYMDAVSEKNGISFTNEYLLEQLYGQGL